MFTSRFPLLAALVLAFGTNFPGELPFAADAAPESTSAQPQPPPPPIVTATLTISPDYYNGYPNGYHWVHIIGTSSATNAPVVARFYGEDLIYNQYLFSLGGQQVHTDSIGRFIIFQKVYRTLLDEDFGQDEVHAIIDVTNGGSVRTNTVRQWF